MAYQCNKCGKSFITPRGFKVHADREHSHLPHNKRAKAKTV